MGKIILSAYLAGVVYYMIKYKRDKGLIGLENLYDIIGYTIAIMIWPIWIIIGIRQGFKEEMDKGN